MPYFFYSSLLYLLTPIFLLRLLIRSRKNPHYRQRISERFGYLPVFSEEIKIWVHAVSVGETMAARPLIEKLIAVYGRGHILLTTTTPTGSDTVSRLFAGRVQHAYFPYDLPAVVSRYLHRVKPGVLVCMETEIWPNLWRACRHRDIPVVLANARMSARSASRYLKLGGFAARVMNDATLIACRNESDLMRFRNIGVKESKLRVIGDLKFDVVAPKALTDASARLKKSWGEQRLVLVAASTHAGEDEQILAVFTALRRVFPDLLLIIAPRHPERFDDVAALLAASPYHYQRRSAAKEDFHPSTDVVLGDSMGELMLWFHCANVVFMGGSLVPLGGHNPIEPLACGAATLTGPHVFNFEYLFNELSQKGIVRIVADKQQLIETILELLQDSKKRSEMGRKGLELISNSRGATRRFTNEISQLTSSSTIKS